MSFASTVADGPLLAAAGAAALVGLLGFLSPCVLPLVPGYLSYVTGLSGSATVASPEPVPAAAATPAAANNPAERTRTGWVRPSRRPSSLGVRDPATAAAGRNGRVLAGAALFVVGFSVIFVGSGALFGQFAAAITTHRLLLERVGGAVTLAMAAVLAGLVPAAQREFKIRRLPRAGLAGAPLLGAAFGLAWTPCLTPTVSAVYSLALSQSTAARGAVLAAAYCVGLGVPFLAVAAGVRWVTGALAFVRRHIRAVNLIGAVLLAVIGLALLTGIWDHWMNELRATVGPASGFGSGL